MYRYFELFIYFDLDTFFGLDTIFFLTDLSNRCNHHGNQITTNKLGNILFTCLCIENNNDPQNFTHDAIFLRATEKTSGSALLFKWPLHVHVLNYEWNQVNFLTMVLVKLTW